ncbi:MAG: acyl-CoA thioesterase [Alphaproteobacteria bacterium]|nr:acyl-CoA thioesterase [Rickettsiales bacterium]
MEQKQETIKIDLPLSKQQAVLYKVTVALEDIHFDQTAYHVSYVRMLDRARGEWLISIGSSNGQMSRESKFLVISQMQIKFVKPALLEQKLTVYTKVHSLTGTGFVFNQQIKDESDRIICKAEYKMAAVIGKKDKTFAPCRLRTELPKIYTEVSRVVKSCS